MTTDMTSNRPYLLRAFYDWIIDNQCTPHLQVDAGYPGTLVPQQYVADGQIVLNIATRAVNGFAMDNEAIRFTTRFGGVPTEIFIPIAAVLRIFARENGQGIVFPPEEHPDPSPTPPNPKKGKPTKTGGAKPSLKVVK